MDGNGKIEANGKRSETGKNRKSVGWVETGKIERNRKTDINGKKEANRKRVEIRKIGKMGGSGKWREAGD